MKIKYLLVFILLVSVSFTAKAQFKNYGVKGGIQYVQLLPFSEFDARYSFLARGFLNFEINNTMSFDIGIGYGQYKTDDHFNTYPTNSPGDHDVSTDIIPVDVRLRISPFPSKNWNPYFYAGAGLMSYTVKNVPGDSLIPQYNTKESGWMGIFPIGIGTEVKLSNNVLLDINGGATYTTTDLINNFVVPSFTDSYAQLGLGLTFTGSDICNTDMDKDGLTYCREEQIGTDPNNPDTDGDGLKDGPEVEQYKTNPLNKDTDGDSLNDGDEVMKYSTNPLNKDSDSDELTDGDEIQKYLTLPNNADTDSDGLKDGAEVLTHKTDPKMVDTDLGSIGDGVEVGRGTNPLNRADDVPPAPVVEERVKVGQVITLEGINFATNSYEISSLAEDKLEIALSSLRDNPAVEVEIIGHTDNTGGRDHNMQLSLNRAESVKQWFVSQGIAASRITTIGMGPDDPISSNDSEEGRFQNRRIDFKRVK